MENSRPFYTCMLTAKQKEILFPADCMQIIINIYGKKTDNLTPKFIFNLISDMMQTHVDIECVENSEIISVVNNFINS